MPEKILNLYAGIGGNRKLWHDVVVTAVERDPAIAAIYQDFFPDDTVIVSDAHQYLVEHYQEFDFIWSSPPCPSHSRIRNQLGVAIGKVPAIYPDMALYQEIIFLQHHVDSLWCIENVIPYYPPLIPPTAQLHRHYFWTNFYIAPKKFTINAKIGRVGNTIAHLQNTHEIDISMYSGIDKRKVLKNCVLPELGLWIFEQRHQFQQLRFV